MTDPVPGSDCILLQAGIPSVDWSEALKIHKSKICQSHHNSQLWVGPQPWGQLPGQPWGGASRAGKIDSLVLWDRGQETDFGGTQWHDG